MTYLDELAHRVLEERKKQDQEEIAYLKNNGQERCPKCKAIGEIGKDCSCNPFSQPVSLDDFED